ncbi:MFS transporter [uncultured Aquimarina sp.]|uniref:MFS transporter n=1 Tax=uncultured Aquimarina sp. TaxID=575652 RepID=UPI002605AC70|nr:MFS transporter [uncultured Aquimarina sp.]
MERILHQKHNKYTFIYAFSRLLERASYYGLRAIMVLYMIGESLQMPRDEALGIYGMFTLYLVFSQIPGALIGDLLIGNKKAMIAGGIIQAVGAFVFCIPSSIGLYIGLGLVLLGGGLFTPNITAHFGKMYLGKTKLLDSAFTIFYLMVNLGAAIGVVIIGYMGETYGFNIGFIIAGILMLIAIAFPLLSKDSNILESERVTMPSINQRVVKILAAFLLVGLFWTTYEMTSIRAYEIQSILADNIVLKSIWSSLNSIFIIVISIILILLWTFFYYRQSTKVTIGFIFGTISFGLLLLIPEIPTEQHLLLYFISLLFLGISEVHIAPIIHSILTRYTNPKYLAIIISLAFIPTRLFSLAIGLFNDYLYKNSIFSLKLGMILMILISIGLVIYTMMKKEN